MSAADETVEDSLAATRPVKSAERALTILGVLGNARDPMTVTALHRATGYPRSSLHQLLHTMAAMSWIEYTDDGSMVGVGSRALLVGTSYLDRDGALQHATRTLEQIREESGYTTHYARLDGSNVIYLATRETTASHRATSRVGRQLPAHATALGKALLAELSSAEVSATLPADPLSRLTPKTLATLDDVQQQLDSVRSAGFAVEREENTLGVSCVAAVVPYRIPGTDAISCSIPLEQATAKEVARVGRIIRSNATTLAVTLRMHGIR